METRYGMNHESYSAYNRWHWIIGLILAALLFLLPWLFNIGPNSWKQCAAPAAAVAAPVAVAAAPAVVAEAAPAPAAVAPVVEEPVPAAKVYFAVNKVNLPGDVDKTLADVLAYLGRHPGAKATISGFHDPRGSADHNRWLADNRAANVKAALEKAGIGADRLVINQAQETTGTGSHEEARRVEVGVQP